MIANKLSINLTPFKILKIYKYYNYSGSGRKQWDYFSPGWVKILRSNKSVISVQDLSWNDSDNIDISNINEQTFFIIYGGSGPGFSGYGSGGSMIITRIDFQI